MELNERMALFGHSLLDSSPLAGVKELHEVIQTQEQFPEAITLTDNQTCPNNNNLLSS